MAEQGAIDQIAKATQTATSMARRAADEARTKEVRALQSDMVKALQNRDTKQLDLLNIRLNELIASEGAEKQAFVDSLKSLRDAGKALGVEINVAEEATQEEKAALAAAEAAVKTADDAYAEIVKNPPWLLAASRTDALKTAADAAKEHLEQVQIANARSASKRLDSIDITQASQRLIQVSELSQKSVEDRRTIIAAEVENARAEIERLQTADLHLATELDDLKIAVAQADQACSDAKIDLERMVPGTEAYSQQQSVVQTAEDALKEATNKRDTAMEVRNQVQLNLEYTKVHLAGQRDIEKALLVFQKTMEEQLNGLVVQYKSRVEAARALADLKFASDVHETGNAVMSGFASYLAKAGTTASSEVTTMAEKQPEMIRQARDTAAQQVAAAVATQARIDAVFADMERDYKQQDAA